MFDRARMSLADVERRLRRKMRLHPKGNPSAEPGTDSLDSQEQPQQEQEKAA
jgi:hypothetical protein